MIVHLAYEFHIPPATLEHESPRMLATMERYLQWRVSEMNKQREKARKR